MDIVGETHTETVDQGIEKVISKCWTSRVSCSGNFARTNARFIAAAASSGLITTRVSPGVFANQWVATPAGLAALDSFFEGCLFDEL